MKVNYPESFDNDTTLFHVYDSLKVGLDKDYNPGDTEIYAKDNIDKFPSNGIITIVDLCNSSATSFFYKNKKDNYFYNLEILKESKDDFKDKKSSYITQQVMAEYHNVIKDAIVEIEKVIGTVKDSEVSIYNRINNLTSKIYTPKAWFESDGVKGVAPFTVKFISKSSGVIGPVGNVVYTWNFENEILRTSNNIVEKTFEEPGEYTISLLVENDFGSDFIEFPKMISVISPIKEKPKIKFLPNEEQLINENQIRTSINQDIKIQIENTDNELEYEWILLPQEEKLNGKEIILNNLQGGLLYDLAVKSKNSNNSFLISVFKNSIDIVDSVNLWLWNINEENSNISSYEMSVVTESFKTKNNSNFNTNIKDFSYELLKKNGCENKTSLCSGLGGLCVLYWMQDENLNFYEYNPFLDVYFKSLNPKKINKNICSFSIQNNLYLFLDEENPTNKTTIKLHNNSISNTLLEKYSFTNGSYELIYNKNKYYRTTSNENTAFILAGDGNGFSNFYKTEGNIGNLFINLNKLNSLPEKAKNGNIISTNDKVYFINNNGNILCYNSFIGVWQKINSNLKNNEKNNFLISVNKNSIYMSFDDNKFIKFNEIDHSIKTLSNRPAGKQWLTKIY